jgi:hypothetical protein
VHTTDGFGATAWIGQSDQTRGAFDTKMNALAPPAGFGSMPRIVFRHPELGANAGDYMTEAHHSGTQDPWELTVSTPDPRKTYTLTWSSMATVPRSIQLTLVDEATGARQFMRSSSGYSFVPGTSPTRAFKVLIEDRGTSRLTITGVIARPTRAAGGTTQIQYNLSQGATIATEIRGADGRLVRRLATGRAATTGANSLLWDMRDDRGITVPSGQYLIHITATTPGGETVRTVEPVTVVR